VQVDTGPVCLAGQAETRSGEETSGTGRATRKAHFPSKTAGKGFAYRSPPKEECVSAGCKSAGVPPGGGAVDVIDRASAYFD
jgi:hypothetical protein